MANSGCPSPNSPASRTSRKASSAPSCTMALASPAVTRRLTPAAPVSRLRLLGLPAGEEGLEGVEDEVGPLLGRIVAGRHREAAQVVGPLGPGLHRLVVAPAVAVGAPDDEHRAGEPALAVVGLVHLDDDPHPRAVIPQDPLNLRQPGPPPFLPPGTRAQAP